MWIALLLLFACLLAVAPRRRASETFAQLPSTPDTRVEALCGSGWSVLGSPRYTGVADCKRAGLAQPWVASLLADDPTFVAAQRAATAATAASFPPQLQGRVDMACELGYPLMNSDDVVYADAAACRGDPKTAMMASDPALRSHVEPMFLDDTYFACAVGAFGAGDRNAFQACGDAWQALRG